MKEKWEITLQTAIVISMRDNLNTINNSVIRSRVAATQPAVTETPVTTTTTMMMI